MPTGKFALSGFRIFGKGSRKAPEKVENFIVLRADKEKMEKEKFMDSLATKSRCRWLCHLFRKIS